MPLDRLWSHEATRLKGPSHPKLDKPIYYMFSKMWVFKQIVGVTCLNGISHPELCCEVIDTKVYATLSLKPRKSPKYVHAHLERITQYVDC